MRHARVLIAAIGLIAAAALPAVAIGRHAPDSAPAPVGPAVNREAPASACTVEISETVGAEPLRLCDVQPVTVTLGLSCPVRLPIHVVFVIGNHLAMQDDLDTVKQAARNALNAIPWAPGDMAGVVSISTQARKELDLTENKGAASGAINRIQLDPINPFTKYYDWVGTAQGMLEDARKGARSPVEMIVVYSTGCPTGFEQYCSRQIASAGKAKGAGMWLSGVCNPNARPFGFPLPSGHCKTLQQMSTSGYYHDLNQANQVGDDLVGLSELGRTLKLSSVTLQEALAPGVQLIAGSALPAPKVKGQTLTFEWANVAPGGRLTVTYGVKAPSVGGVPLRTGDSQVQLVDSLDRGAGPFAVPTRTMNVVACDAVPPTATPTATPVATETPTVPPTPTATPTDQPTAAPTTTPAPTATATARPSRLALPLVMRRVCRHSPAVADVVLALDASSSMAEPSGGGSKIQAARDAAVAFVRLLGAGDQAALVAFHRESTVTALTGDRAALEAAIRGVTTQPGTRIDLALAAASAELASARARPGSTRVIILLTDGRTEADSGPAALAQAAASKAQGVLLYTIGLGDDVDGDFLRQVASTAGAYYPAPSAANLQSIYEQVARDLPCPGGVVLGQP